MELKPPKGFKSAKPDDVVKIHALAEEQIWIGDGLKIEDGFASRYDCTKAKWVALNSAKVSEVVWAMPIDANPIWEIQIGTDTSEK